MSEPSSSRELGPVSPSLLSRLACPLRIAFEQASTGGRQPASDAASLGTVAHRAIELVIGGDDLDDAWLRACSEERDETGVDPGTLPAARRTLLRLRKHVPRLLELLATSDHPRRLPETWLETTDGALGGKPDLVATSDDHTAIVIDYKTGLVTTDEGVEATYVRQLLFYGALVQECLNALPTMLVLLSLREGVVEVDPTPEAMTEVATDARAARSEFNRRVPGAQPANASEENCCWCRHAANCGAFWNSVEPHWVSSVGSVVRGTVDAQPEHAATGVTTIQVMVDAGPFAGSRAIVSGVPSELVSRASIGSVVSALDLRVRSEDPLVLTWTNRASTLGRLTVH
jgi:RecB family exonuclease